MSTVYRFHDDVAINPPDGPTFYVNVVQAQAMEDAIHDVIRDIKDRKFTRSTVGTVTLPGGVCTEPECVSFECKPSQSCACRMWSGELLVRDGRGVVE